MLVRRSVLEVMMTGGRGPMIVTDEEDKMTAVLIILVFAQGIDTTLGAWP